MSETAQAVHTQQVTSWPPATTTEASGAAPETVRIAPDPDQVKQRDAFFDNAKYLAIVLVAMGHVWEPLRSDSRAVTALYMTVYAFHMPAFIVISGYFSRSFDASPRKVKRLITGVAIPYVVFETAYPSSPGGRRCPGPPGQPAGPVVSDVVPGGAVHLAADHPDLEEPAVPAAGRARRRDGRDAVTVHRQ